jgi:serine protease Do
VTSDGKKYPAKVLALDPVQDIAIIKVNGVLNLNPVKLGNSDNLQIGQTVIAIGNSLGEFRNTISVGVISGLGRTITASGGGLIETLEDVIQTDAAINEGNSGGPLLNLKGEVIGINVATVSNAQNIGFSLPINLAKKDISQVKGTGKISYPFLGVYYTLITPALKEKYNLSVDYGALVGVDQNGKLTEKATIANSPAEKAGVLRNDIILEIGGQKITADNTLSKIIANYNPGDKTTIKILRGGEEKTLDITIGERNE